MTDQEIFDFIVNHLRTQGEKASIGEMAGCKYRIEKNGKTLKCAVGCLIKDEFYNPSLENFGALSTMVLQALNRSLGMDLYRDSNTAALIARMQRIHDQYIPHNWEREFAITAQNYVLKYTEPG